MTSAPAAAREGSTPETARAPSRAAAGCPGQANAGAAPPAKTVSNRRKLVWLAALAAALVLIVLLSLAVGARSIAPATVLDALINFDPANGDHAVVHARMVRTAAGLVVGLALGLAGTSMQGVARNPLADPGILGRQRRGGTGRGGRNLLLRRGQRLQLPVVCLRRQCRCRRGGLHGGQPGPQRRNTRQAGPGRCRHVGRHGLAHERHAGHQPGLTGTVPQLAGGRAGRKVVGGDCWPCCRLWWRAP